MPQNNIGMILRTKRNQSNVTLSELSKKTGLSIGYLSQFERGLTSTTPDTVDKIASALGIEINMDAIWSDENTEPVVRSYDREVSSIEGGTIIKYNLSNLRGSENMFPRFVQLLPREGMEKPDIYSHQGQEFIYVLEGILSLEIEDQIYDLYPEDSAHYLSTKPHNWFNKTNKTVKFITVNLRDEQEEEKEA